MRLRDDPVEITRYDVGLIDVPLEDGRVLRVAVESEAGGAPVQVHLSAGFGEGRAWQAAPGQRLQMPAGAIPALTRTLAVLMRPSDAGGAP